MTLRTRTFSILVVVAIPAFRSPTGGLRHRSRKGNGATCRQLDRIEGIWEYPEDNVTVLIRKADHEPYAYGIDVVRG